MFFVILYRHLLLEKYHKMLYINKKSSIFRFLRIAGVLCMMLMLFPIPRAEAAKDKKFVVVLDAGHGGHDAGAIGVKGKEKNINLAVALKVGALIEKNMPDVTVKYTRKKDTFLGLKERTDFAHKNHGDLFISIHANSISKKNKKRKTIKGASTYVLGLARSKQNLEIAQRENSVIMLEDDYNTKYEGFDPNSPESYIIFETMQDAYRDQSIAFAGLVQDEMVRVAGREDRGVRQNIFYVLARTGMPSVLIELDFICNPKQEDFMLSSKGQERMAQAIYNAFVSYKASYDGNNSVGSKSQRPDPSVITDEPEPEVHDDSPAEQSATQVASDPSGERIYKVQFMALPKKLKQGNKAFKGLSPVDVYYDNGYYKYTYGSAKSRKNIDADFKKVRKLFKDAFVIVMQDGKRIE